MITRQYLTKEIGEYLAKDKLALSILRASADVEACLFDKLFFELKINTKLMEKWTLGTLINWNIKQNLIDMKYEKALRDFQKLRNLFVHDRSFQLTLDSNSKYKKRIKSIINQIIDFLDNTLIQYEPDGELETNYADYLDKTRAKFEKLSVPE